MTTPNISEILRRIGVLSGELGREGVEMPELTRTAAALAQYNQTHTPSLEVVEPEPTPVPLPAHMEHRWEMFEAFFVALNQKFGWPNRDQYIWFAEIAANLTTGRGHGAGTGGGEVGEAPFAGGPYLREYGAWVDINTWLPTYLATFSFNIDGGWY